MSVIVELTLPAETFELGRILDVEDEASVVLETMVPLGERPIPFFRVRGGRESFEAAAREHAAVDAIHEVNTHEDETLYALDWQIGADTFFEGILARDAHVLEASGASQTWMFELRFPSHDALADFQEYCTDASLPIDVERIYNPTKPDAGPWYGLTAPQREMLTLAVQEGYYSIPRQASTNDLAEAVGISDQAVTERLRRGIVALVTNTLLLTEAESESTAGVS